MRRDPYLLSMICLTLMLVVFSLGDWPPSPPVLTVALTGIAVLFVALGRPIRLFMEMRYRLSMEE